MVSEVQSVTASEAEIAAAAQEAQEALKRQEPHGQVDLPQDMREGTVKPMQYRISPADIGAWVMVWELKIDADGEVYGDPTRAPRQQLGLWLQKKRPDGGPRFSVEMPKRLRAEATIPCIYNGSPPCNKKFYTRQDMVMHVRGYPGYMGSHASFAEVNKVLLDKIMERVAEDNPRLAQMAEAIANMEDRGLVSVAVTPQPRHDALDLDAGKPTVSTLGLPKQEGCASCDWKFKENWSEAQRQQFLMAHLRGSHKEELE